MNRPILVCAFLVAAAAPLAAQSASQSNPYEGTSNPPPDDTITTQAQQQQPTPKPSAAHPYQQPAPSSAQQAVVPAQPAEQPTPPASADSEANPPAPGNSDQGDDGIVQVAPPETHPVLNQRAVASDPDGGIVHPQPLPPNSLSEGTSIRVRLLDRLSSSSNEDGDAFHSIVASDVLQGGQVLIPAGAEIDGRVMHVSTGHAGGHGSMRLDPDTVILPDGVRYRLYAQVSGTPGSYTHVTGEGTVVPDSRLGHDGVEYGGAVGAGAVAGAVVGGPVGALTGSLIGAGLVTTHLLVAHPQATLDSGTVLIFSLTEPLTLVPDASTGN